MLAGGADCVWRVKMATRTMFENSNEVGVFANLTSAYCMVALGGSASFFR